MLSTIFPGPIGTIVAYPFIVQKHLKAPKEEVGSSHAFFMLESGCFSTAVLRVSAAALGILAIYLWDISPLVGAVAGSVLSVPVTLIAGGALLGHYGIVAVIDSLACKCLALFTEGLICTIASYAALKYSNHPSLPKGLLDNTFTAMGEKIGAALATKIKLS